MVDISAYYDFLIDENNDPVYDDKPLKNYMDKWDGQDFIDKLELEGRKSVLEIGVGTGRMALRIAPLCRKFSGIDISHKTIERARQNLVNCNNINLICGDFLSYNFINKFDVIYSTLTFMHIEKKQEAINKVSTLLNCGGRFVLSIDNNSSDFLDYGELRINLYPDDIEKTTNYIIFSGLKIKEIFSTDFATVFVAEK